MDNAPFDDAIRRKLSASSREAVQNQTYFALKVLAEMSLEKGWFTAERKKEDTITIAMTLRLPKRFSPTREMLETLVGELGGDSQSVKYDPEKRRLAFDRPAPEGAP